jgi:type III pantothenate kinase
MKLLLDVGNTRIKWAWLRNAELLPGGAVVHKGRSPGAALDGMQLNAVPIEVCAASVAGATLQGAVTDWVAARWNVPLRWVKSQSSAAGVRNAYTHPEQLGVDRWLAVVGAYHRVRGAAFVVDAGTALTIDVVDAVGNHRGGLIAPGVQTQRVALHQGTQLPPVDGSHSLALLAQDTQAAIALGTVHGALGLIERVRDQVMQLGGPMPTLITGGEAGLLAPHLEGCQHVPDLVLEGLVRVIRDAG